jgi:hypothetical protein
MIQCQIGFHQAILQLNANQRYLPQKYYLKIQIPWFGFDWMCLFENFLFLSTLNFLQYL